MATLNLTAPTSGQNLVVITEELNTLNLGFDTSTALFEKSGNDFIITFEDGTSIVLQGFYEVYSAEFVPDFVMNDMLVSGEDFFAAFDSNLMPAAGAESNSSARNAADATNNLESDLVVGNANIGSGLNSLGGVDGYYANAADGLFMVNEAGIYLEEDAPEVTIPTLPPNPPIPPIFTGDREITVQESGIKNDTTVKWEVPDGYEIVGVVGQGNYGEANIVDGNLEYELNDAYDHSSTDGDVAAKGDTITVIVKDNLGNEMEVVVDVAIVDDEPTISGDNLGNVTEGDSITGKVDIDYGADGKGSITVNGKEPNADGSYDVGFGKVTIDDDGNYTLTVDPNYTGDPNQSFDIEVTDKDSNGDDKASITIEVTIDQAKGPEDLSFNVDESDVLTGATTTWQPPDGFEIVTAGNGSLGNVTVNKDGNLEYELNGAIDHTGKNDDVYEGADTITVTLKDPNGNLIDVEVRVDVTDDVPTLSTEDTSFNVTEGASVEGKLEIDFGADGAGSITVNGNGPSADGSYDLGYGKVVIEADGSYTVTVNPDYSTTANAKQEIKFEITDADGDKADVTIGLTIDQSGTPEITGSIVVDEANIGTADATVNWQAPDGYIITGVENNNASLGTANLVNGKLEYTITDSHMHDAGQGENLATGVDTVIVTMTDPNGNTVQVEVKVNVKDDVPTIDADNSATVLEGTTITGKLEIDFGADGAHSEAITINGVEANAEGKFDVGFGIVTINPDGTYSLSVDANYEGSADQTLKITVQDADGDIAETEINVTIDQATAPDISDRDSITADEAGIADNATVTWAPPEGFTIDKDNIQDGALGTVTYNEDGTISYELNENIKHDILEGEDTEVKGADTITIPLKDEFGNIVYVDVKINVLDDVPTIESTELAPVTEGGSVTGQLTIDFGADGGDISSLTVNGQEGISSFSQTGNLIYNFDFGTVVVAQDGSYTVHINPDYEGDGEELVFAVTDGDGDTVSTDSITVTINQAGEPDLTDNNSITADEAGIADNATVTWTPPEGFTIDKDSIQDGALGTVTYNEDGTISYELNENIKHDILEGEDTEVKGADTITITLVDKNGNTFEVTIDVNVKDDVPTISGDNLGSVVEGATVTGNIDFDFGADGAAQSGSITINGVEAGADGKFDLGFGTVTLDPTTGDYTLEINANYNPVDYPDTDLTFTVTDSDGDSVSHTVEVNVQNADAPNVSDMDINADEANIGTENSTVTWTPPAGYEIVGTPTASLGNVTIVNGELVYELTDTVDHTQQGADTKENADSVKVTLRDENGNEFEVTVDVNVKDDVPTIDADNSATVLEGTTITGKLEIDFGADGAHSEAITINGVEANAEGKFDVGFGIVTINPDGTYSLSVDANYEGSADQTLKITVQDADGDIAETEINVTIDQATAPDISDRDSITADEAGIADNATVTWAPPEGFTIDKDNIQDGALGTVTYNEDGTISYELNENIKHDILEGEDTEVKGADTITIPLKDEFGNIVYVDVKIDVLDDVPTIESTELAPVTEGGSVTGQLTIDFGADGGDISSLTINGETGISSFSQTGNLIYNFDFGTVVVAQDGSYTVHINPNYEGDGEELVFAVTDGDGDTVSTDSITVTINQAGEPDLTDNNSITADEAGIADNATVTWTPPEGFTIDKDSIQDGALGTVTYNEDGTISYELNENIKHDILEGEDTEVKGADTITITLVDKNGNTFEVTIDVNVKDDVPTISGDNLGSVVEGATVTGNIDFDFGADGAATSGSITINGVEADADGKFDLGFGTVTLDPTTGDYQLTINPNFSADSADLTFVVTDSDGDSVSHTVEVNVQNADAPDVSDMDINADEANIGTENSTVTWTPPAGYEIVGIPTASLGNVTIVNGELVYELTDTVDHTQQGTDTKENADSVKVTLRDENGNEFEVTVDVNVKDDVPTIEADNSATVLEGTTITGKLEIDFGADGAHSEAITINGVEANAEGKFDVGFGIVTINPDGTYSLSVDANYEGSADQTLKITVQDADGDIAETTVQVTIDQAAIPDDTNLRIEADEAGIESNTTVSWTPPDGFTIVAVANGSLGNANIVNGTVEYELNNATTHDKDKGEDTVVESADTITVVLKDANGNLVEVQIEVDVKDDVPTISGTSLESVEEGTSVEGQLDIDFGADGAASVDSLTINGLSPNADGKFEFDFGTVVVKADGSYTVTVNPDYDGVASQDLVFEVTDADGDTASTTVELNIEQADAPEDTVFDVEVDEADLGSENGATVTWTPPAGYEIVSATVGSIGNVSYDKDNLSYELNGAIDHLGDDDIVKDNAETITVTLRDENGNTFEVTVNVDVVDAVPTIESVEGLDNLNVEEGSSVSGQLNIDFGADGESTDIDLPALTVNGVKANEDGEFVLDFATVTVASDGSYTVVVNPNYDPESNGEQLTFEITDGDGDKASTTVDLNITQADAPEDTVFDVEVDEADLGSENGATVTWTPPAGYEIVSATVGSIGNVSYDKDNLSYELNGAIDHLGDDDIVKDNAETITVTLRDENGNTFEVTVNIDVVDDVPTIESVDGLDSVEEGSSVSGQLDIDFGADGAATDTASITVNGVEANAEGKFDVGFGIVTLDPATGKYELEVKPDFDPNEYKNPSLTFEVTDGDGDTASTTVDLDITQAQGPEADDNNSIVADEAGIENNTVVDWAGLDGYTIIGIETNGQYGNATLTDGVLSYELDTAYGHDAGEGTNTQKGADTITVTVQDANGNTFSYEVKVDIVDDVPTIGATLDDTSVEEGTAITGSLDIDFGADGGDLSSLTINGQSINEKGEFDLGFGIVTVDPATGDYTLKVNPDYDPEANPNQNLVFEVTDTDGDTASSTVTVEITQATIPSDTNLTIEADEAGIKDNATVNWKAPDGYSIVSLGGSSIGSATIVGGELVYQLNSTVNHEAGEGTNTEKGADTVTVILRDENGNNITVEVKIDVVDDVPTIESVKGLDDVMEGTSVSGQLDIDFGADGAASSAEITVNGVTVNNNGEFVLDFGTVTINPDGEYTLTINPNYTGDAEQTLTFEITDADGDVASTTVDVTITQAEAPDDSDFIIKADEDGIANNETVSWTPPSGYEIVGAVIKGEAGDTIYGNIVSSSTGELVYELDNTIDHTQQGEDYALGDTIEVTLIDKFGNEVTVDVKVNVKDSVPTIGDVSDLGSVEEGTSVSGSIGIDFGADGAGSITINGVSASEDGTYDVGFGKVTIDADGNYTLTVNPNYEGNGESLEFVVTDGDGDVVSTTVDVEITQAGLPDGTDLTVQADEAGIKDNATVSWTPPAGYEIVADSAFSSLGTVTIVNGNIVYELNDAIDHESGQGTNIKDGADTITVQLKDPNGNIIDVEVQVNVKDDVPTISGSNLGSVMEGTSVNGTISFDFGADGAASENAFTINGVASENGVYDLGFGTLTLDSDGNYTIKVNPNYEGNGENLTFEVTDSDGDTVTHTVDVNITQSAIPDGTDLNVTTDEADLASGSAVDTWSPPDGFIITDIVSFDPSVGTVTIDKDGNLVYELNDVLDHGDEQGKNTITPDKVIVMVQDKYGNDIKVEINVNVVDDVPTISASNLGGVEAGYSTTGQLEFDFGADGGSLDSLTINGQKADEDGKFVIDGFGTITVMPDGSYTLEVNSDYKGRGQEIIFEISDNDGDKASITLATQVQIMNFYSFDDNGLLEWDDKEKYYEGEDGLMQSITTLYGTDGDDTVTGHYLAGTNTVIDTGDGNDTINIGMKDKNHSDSGYDATFFAGMSGGTIDAGAGDDTINVHEMSGGTILAGTGDDTITIGFNEITGNMTAGTIDAGDGNDTINIEYLHSNQTAANILGGAGDDTIFIETMTGGNVQGGTGDDTIIVENLTLSSSVTIGGGEGNDTFIYANSGNNTIVLDDSGNVTINGNNNGAEISGFENIGGGSGNDTIYGNSSDNIIIGGQGSDIMFGGGGDDTFLFQDGDFTVGATDTIKDFDNGDMLDLRAFIDNGMTATTTVDASGNVIVSVGDDASGYQNIVLEGLGNNSSFNQEDFNNSLNNDGFIKL